MLARSKLGITQRELSLETKISIPQIVRYEGGRSHPRLSAVLKLSKALGVSPNELDPSLTNNGVRVVVEFSNDEYEKLTKRFNGSEEEIASFVREAALGALLLK